MPHWPPGVGLRGSSCELPVAARWDLRQRQEMSACRKEKGCLGKRFRTPEALQNRGQVCTTANAGPQPFGRPTRGFSRLAALGEPPAPASRTCLASPTKNSLLIKHQLLPSTHPLSSLLCVCSRSLLEHFTSRVVKVTCCRGSGFPSLSGLLNAPWLGGTVCLKGRPGAELRVGQVHRAWLVLLT